MSDIFREATFNWGDKEYTFTPSMAFLRRLERRRIDDDGVSFRVSVMKLNVQAIAGEPLFAEMALIIKEVMVAAGAASFDEAEIMQDVHAGKGAEVAALWYEIMAAISPVPKEEKKSTPQA